MRLGAHERDVAREPPLPQGLGGAHARQRGTDDDDPRHGHRGYGRRSAEHDGAVAEHEDAPLDVGAHRSGEHDGLEVTAPAGELGDVVTVGHVGDVLGDDWTLVEVRGHVVRGGPDDLDTPVVGLSVRIGPDERRKERMVDVDHPSEPVHREVAGQHEHVAREHDELDVERPEQVAERPLLIAAGIVSRSHRHVVEGHGERAGQRSGIVVVRHDGAHVESEVAISGAGQQVGSAMQLARAQDRGSGTVRECIEGELHRPVGRQRGEALPQGVEGRRAGMSELDALKEHRIGGVRVLLGVDDVAPRRSDPAGDRRHDSGAIGTRDEEHGDGIHDGGDDGNRTHDLLLAKQALYQLSYVPG